MVQQLLIIEDEYSLDEMNLFAIVTMWWPVSSSI